MEATAAFTVKDAGCFNEKDKSTITAMIDKFEQGGTKAFEAKIAQVGSKVVAEITGQKMGWALITFRGSLSRRVAPVAPDDKYSVVE